MPKGSDGKRNDIGLARREPLRCKNCEIWSRRGQSPLNSITRAHVRLLATAILLLSNSSAAHDQLQTQPIRDFHTDRTLLPACAKEEIDRLETDVERFAKHRNPKGAWEVARTMLCDQRAPFNNMPKLVSQEQYGLTDNAGQSFSLVPRKRINALKGQAYGVTVEALRSDLRFNYNTAGICTGGFTLRHVSSEWLLVDVGEACD